MTAKKNEKEFKINLGTDGFVGIKERFTAGEKTFLVFDSDEYRLGELNATIADGALAKRRVVKGNRLDITEFCKRAGFLEINVDLIEKGVVLKTWKLEPFVVRENGGSYELIPEIALLRKEVRMMKKALKELNKKIDETM